MWISVPSMANESERVSMNWLCVSIYNGNAIRFAVYTLKLYTQKSRVNDAFLRIVVTRVYGFAWFSLSEIYIWLEIQAHYQLIKQKAKIRRNKRTLEQSIWIFQFGAAQWKVFYSWKCCFFESNVQVKRYSDEKNGTSSSGFILLILFIAAFLYLFLSFCELYTAHRIVCLASFTYITHMIFALLQSKL